MQSVESKEEAPEIYDDLDSPRFDETVSVTTSWHHMSAFGFLQRMLCLILRTLTHDELQLFYLSLRCFDKQKIFQGAAPRTNEHNFFTTPQSVTFGKRLPKMTETYARLFVAAAALEVVRGFNDVPVQIFRNWVGMSVALWFDVERDFGAPRKDAWDASMADLLERSLCMVEVSSELLGPPQLLLKVSLRMSILRKCVLCVRSYTTIAHFGRVRVSLTTLNPRVTRKPRQRCDMKRIINEIGTCSMPCAVWEKRK